MRHTLTFLALAAVTACSAAKTIDFTSSASSSGSTSTAGTGAGTGGTASASTAGTGAVHLGAGGGGVGGGSGTGGSTANAEVFGQSAGTLYKLDPITKVVTTVGDFQGCGDEVIDIALDKDSNMYGTSTDGVYKIDKTTAVCTQIAAGSYPNSLSFVPAGTLDPNVEALVGYLGNQYVRIDTTTGAVTNVGNKSLGACQSSGDIVSVIGGGTYLTVTGCIGCLDSDCIVEVDPKTGALVKNLGKVGHIAVYGLAFWGGSAYGFDAAGQLFQIDLMNGTSTTIPIPMAPPGLSFYGAGSSTSVPLMPPT